MITRPDREIGRMAHDEHESVTRLLAELRDGRSEAFDELFPLLYLDLHELAHRHRGTWRGNQTLDTTALVHEAYLKLAGGKNPSWKTEAHFLAAASKAIRHILINYARDRGAQKRGGDWERVPLHEDKLPGPAGSEGSPWNERLLALDDALERLADLSARQSRIVECRFFGGMTVRQTAEALGFSTATVTRSWAVARAWLHRELSGTLHGSRT